ncbi:hypothetical protein PACTADRAFT_81993 [Pachysolen tannophilus NRRL Y-2460]|uniref:RNA 3'-terminal phosphate cyclase domain-containing protein n=1 Tax=Pachysolen tannophilus NRRL Y-2460 TaxID=669874 RepID=A0A1E4TRX5_PACTA|nr:hypothetical protein PACTADRAFT_81993 [Pachysolen tannophilus NRRL Y-2460]
MSKSESKIKTFRGPRNFRLRLVLATLSGKAIKIEKIRSNDLNPGLKDYEVSFLRLLESVTNGSVIEISYTGTTVIYKPGLIIGGNLIHQCPDSKPVGYFLESMLYLAPFSKKKFSIIFKGITSSKIDASIESIRWGIIPIMEKFGVREVSIHTLKRGSPPLGGGEVHLICNTLLSSPLTLHALEVPKISSVRGVAYCTRVSPSIVNRMIDEVRKVLKPIGCEVNITADVWRGENSGKSPGFGLTLAAESKKNNWRFISEDIGSNGELPEDVANSCCLKLLKEISESGCCGRNQLVFAMVYMCIGKEDIGRLKVHKAQIDDDLIWKLRDIKEVLGAEFYFKDSDDQDQNQLIATVKGIGFTNSSKKIA